VNLDRDEHDIIDIPLTEMQSDIDGDAVLGMGESYISKALLTSIIKPRMEEILEFAKKDLEDSGLFGHTGPRVVMSGGASQLMGLKELAGQIFNKHVRVGKPVAVNGMAESVKGPAFSACVGMLINAAEDHRRSSNSVMHNPIPLRKASGGRLVGWFKENF